MQPDAVELTPKAAEAYAMRGERLPAVVVTGPLDLRYRDDLTGFPFGAMTVMGSLTVSDCRYLRDLPAVMRVRGDFDVCGCERLERLPDVLDVRGSFLAGGRNRIAALPRGASVGRDIDFTWSRTFESLPEDLEVAGSLYLQDCTSLQRIPEGLRVGGDLYATDCIGLEGIGDGLTVSGLADFSGCGLLRNLPGDTFIGDALRMDRTSIGPLSLKSAHIKKVLVGHVPVPARLYLNPTRITLKDLMATRNAEVRRVLAERMGWDAFIAKAENLVEEVDRDPDERVGTLYRLELGGARFPEPLCLLKVRDGTSPVYYYLRVPPGFRKARAANAWTWNLRENEYAPVEET